MSARVCFTSHGQAPLVARGSLAVVHDPDTNVLSFPEEIAEFPWKSCVSFMLPTEKPEHHVGRLNLRVVGRIYELEIA